jgi:hypothetical protein
MRTDYVIRLLVEDLPKRPAGVGAALRIWWPIAAVAAGAGFLAIAGVRTDLLASGFAPTMLKVALGLSIAAVSFVGALWLSRPEVTTAVAAKGLIAIAMFLVVVLATSFWSQGLDAWRMRLFGKSVLPCLTLIPLVAALPLAASLMALRRGATTEPARAGALAGLASAGLAIVAYGLFCTEDSPIFIAAWYSLAAVITGLAGAALGRMLLKW